MAVEVEEKFGVVCLLFVSDANIQLHLPRNAENQTLSACPAQFLKPPLLSVHRPRTVQIGKIKMVSSWSQIAPGDYTEICILLGYRHQETPRQEGPADGPQKRGSLPPFARQSMYV